MAARKKKQKPVERRRQKPEPETYKTLAELEWERGGRKGEKPPAMEGEYLAWWNALSVTEKRVEEIVALMASGRYLSGVTNHHLARVWQRNPSYVLDLIHEAARVFRRYVRNLDGPRQDEIKAEVIQTFQLIRARALQKTDANNLRVALDATRAYGFYCGVQPVAQVDLTHRQGDGAPGEMDDWTVDELEAYAQSGKRPRRALKEVSRQLLAERTDPVAIDTNGHDATPTDEDPTRH